MQPCFHLYAVFYFKSCRFNKSNISFKFGKQHLVSFICSICSQGFKESGYLLQLRRKISKVWCLINLLVWLFIYAIAGLEQHPELKNTCNIILIKIQNYLLQFLIILIRKEGVSFTTYIIVYYVQFLISNITTTIQQVWSSDLIPRGVLQTFKSTNIIQCIRIQ